MEISNWILVENAEPFVIAMSRLVDYSFDQADADGLDFGAVRRGEKRSYPLMGSNGRADLDLEYEVGDSALVVVVRLPEEFRTAAEAIIELLQDYKVVDA